MKQTAILILVAILLTGGCRFKLDILGEDKIKEVVLVKSEAREKIVLIDIEGLIGITSSPSIFGRREGNMLSQVTYRLQQAHEDPWVKGIILRLDTPGGEVTTSDILFKEILNFKEKTGIPVIALMMGVSASGGYYVASACDYIIAHPSTITGSIGVISIFPNIEELFGKIGIKMNVIKSGEMKDSGSAFREMNQEEQKIFQTIVDDFYQNFLKMVYEGRNQAIPFEKLKTIADGRIYTASQALELNLIDEIGYFDAAFEKAKSMAELSRAQVTTYTYYPKLKTNIYATQLSDFSVLETENLQIVLESLKSGFYYLWIPQIYQ